LGHVKILLYNIIVKNPKPTPEAYGELQAAYDFFDKKLFEARLPPCLITFQRKRRSLGYFCAEMWDGSGGRRADEIALNPAFFKGRGLADTLSTLVHEMVHLEQHHFGKPSRNRYHNTEWAAWMDRVGLVPSDTGEPGGKRTGQRMSHYIAQGGKFEKACKQLLSRDFKLSWAEHVEEAPEDSEGDGEGSTAKPTRSKYTCRGCGLNAWAKPAVEIVCGTCRQLLVDIALPVAKSAIG